MKYILTTIILLTSYFAFSQEEKKVFNPYDITLNFYPISIVNNEFGAIDFSVELGLTQNTFLSKNKTNSWFHKQLSSTSFQIRGGYFLNTPYQESSTKQKKGFQLRFQVRKYFHRTMHSINGKRELAGLYFAPEIFYSKQTFIEQYRVVGINETFNDSISEYEIFEKASAKMLGFAKTNIGGYMKIGYQHQIKHIVIDYYVGLGNKYIIIKRNRTDNFDKKIISLGICGTTSIIPNRYFFETGFSIGIR